MGHSRVLVDRKLGGTGGHGGRLVGREFKGDKALLVSVEAWGDGRLLGIRKACGRQRCAELPEQVGPVEGCWQ